MVERQGQVATTQGNITFDRPIVAVLIRQEHLVATDTILGAIHTQYGSESHRGLVKTGSDTYPDGIAISPDRCTLEVGIVVAALDQIQVLVAAAEGIVKNKKKTSKPSGKEE